MAKITNVAATAEVPGYTLIECNDPRGLEESGLLNGVQPGGGTVIVFCNDKNFELFTTWSEWYCWRRWDDNRDMVIYLMEQVKRSKYYHPHVVWDGTGESPRNVL